MVSKASIIDILDTSTIRELLDIFELECSDRRKTSVMKETLLVSSISSEEILHELTAATLKIIAADLGLSSKGRRDELTTRILDQSAAISDAPALRSMSIPETRASAAAGETPPQRPSNREVADSAPARRDRQKRQKPKNWSQTKAEILDQE